MAGEEVERGGGISFIHAGPYIYIYYIFIRVRIKFKMCGSVYFIILFN